MDENYLRGHAIEWLDSKYVYSDTKEPTATTYESRPCGHCDKMQTKEGHDPCLGTLIGIMNACCGHGQERESYVQFLDGNGIYGKDSTDILNILKKHS